MNSPSSCRRCGRPVSDGATDCPDCDSPTTNLPGALPEIPGFQLLRPLGEGGMGTVYLAKDLALGREVAIKFISPRIGGDPDSRARFLREARTMATIEHPNVVRVYSLGETPDGRLFLVMEHVAGEGLDDLLRRKGALPASRALAIFRDVIEGLAAAWRLGIVHRDVKPSNILLDANGRARIADFGLARPVDADSAALTGSGLVLGTPAYVSPEQARALPLDFRSDLYSLGVVLWEMLAGRHPFAGGTPAELVARHLRDPLPPLERPGLTLPRGLRELLEGLTAKDAAARIDSHEGVVGRVDVLLRTLEAGESAPTLAAQLPSSPPRGKNRVAPALAVVAIGVAIGAGLIVARRQTPNSPAASALVIAVAPFDGPDEVSRREGRLAAWRLAERLAGKLGSKSSVRRAPAESPAIHTTEEAQALGRRLGAGIVLWGLAVVRGDDLVIEPQLTPLSFPATTAWRPGTSEPVPEITVRVIHDEAAPPVRLSLARGSDSASNDSSILLAGFGLLKLGRQPGLALELFESVPETSTSLRYRSLALGALGRGGAALDLARRATRFDPGDAAAAAVLGDLLLETGAREAAAEAYRTALGTGIPFSTRKGMLYRDLLWIPELIPWQNGPPRPTGYLLAVEPSTGRVRERHLLPGEATGFSQSGGSLRIHYAVVSPAGVSESTIGLVGDQWDRPFWPDPRWDIRIRNAAKALVLEFASFSDGYPQHLEPHRPIDAPRPKSLQELEAALLSAAENDPTQPWYDLYRGLVMAESGRIGEARTLWAPLFEQRLRSLPWWELARAASEFEAFGYRAEADRAFELAKESAKSRPEFPSDGRFGGLLDQLVSTPFVRTGARIIRATGDLERGYLLLRRGRELSGVGVDADAWGARSWEKHWRTAGRDDRGREEARWLEKAASHPFNPAGSRASADLWLALFVVATISFWGVLFFLVAFSWRQAGPADPRRAPWLFRFGFPQWPPATRWVLAVLWAAAIVSKGGLAFSVAEMQWRDEAPTSLLASPGHAATVSLAESALAEKPDSRDAIEVAAVVEQLAGNLPRARELYDRAGGESAFARQNLQALDRPGDALLMPSTAQLFFALRPSPVRSTIRHFLEPAWSAPGMLPDFTASQVDRPDPHRVDSFWMSTLIVGWLLAAFFVAMPAPREPTKAQDSLRRGLLTLLLVPGRLSIDSGRTVAGAATLATFVFTAWAAIVGLVAVASNQPALPGPFSILAPSFGSFPVPPDPSATLRGTRTRSIGYVFVDSVVDAPALLDVTPGASFFRFATFAALLAWITLHLFELERLRAIWIAAWWRNGQLAAGFAFALGGLVVVAAAAALFAKDATLLPGDPTLVPFPLAILILAAAAVVAIVRHIPDGRRLSILALAGALSVAGVLVAAKLPRLPF